MPRKNIDLEARKLLYECFAKVKPADLPDLFESLMSSAELKDLSRRIMAAKLLKLGYTYDDIADMMGMSEGTINKIHFKTKGSPTIRKILSKSPK